MVFIEHPWGPATTTQWRWWPRIVQQERGKGGDTSLVWLSFRALQINGSLNQMEYSDSWLCVYIPVNQEWVRGKVDEEEEEEEIFNGEEPVTFAVP